MPIIGYDTIGGSHHGRADYSMSLNTIDIVTMPYDALVTSGYIYTTHFGGDGQCNYRMYIYEVGVSDATSILVAQSQIVSNTSTSYQWLAIPFPGTVRLEAGKTYQIAFSQLSVLGGVTPYFKFNTTTNALRTYNNTSFTGPSDTALFGSLGTTRYSAYVEYSEAPREASTSLLAPVDAIPTINTNHTIREASGHEAKYTLDNDPDTWWKPDWYITSALYYDLGASVAVDAISFWLHNYNETYVNDKAWIVSYSDDDVTYHALGLKNFQSYHQQYGPIVVDQFGPITARYWRVQFVDFENVPVTVLPEVSCVWFMKDYSIPWKHQRPENDRIVYHNNESITRSGHRFASPAGVGGQQIMNREFVLTASAGQYDELRAAYDATRGGCLPLILKTNIGSERYYTVTFEEALASNQLEHEYYRPTITLRELGHRRVPFQDRSLIEPHPNAAVYHFRGNALDSSANGRNWTENFTPTYDYGVTEQGTTIIKLDGSKDLSIAAASAGWANPGVASYTVECWGRFSNGSMILRKSTGSGPGLTTTAGFFMGVSGQVLRMSISDGTNAVQFNISHMSRQISGALSTTLEKDWFYVVMVIDRSSNLLHGYINGGDLVYLGDHGQVSIATVGNLDSVADLDCGAFNITGPYIDELTITPGYAMPPAEIAARYLGRVNFGTWGM